jgi:hypothetical protein
MRAAKTCNEARRRSPFDITPALADREVFVLKVGVRGKLLQIVSRSCRSGQNYEIAIAGIGGGAREALWASG